MQYAVQWHAIARSHGLDAQKRIERKSQHLKEYFATPVIPAEARTHDKVARSVVLADHSGRSTPE